MKNQYAMTDAQIEALAAERTQSLGAIDKSDGRYLQALIAGVQAKFGDGRRGRRPATESQLEAIEGIAKPYYDAVLRGVTTLDIVLRPDLSADEVTARTRERNRRATFARTAKSTLATWVKAGGDIRQLDVGAISKSRLLAETRATRSASGVTVIDRVQRGQETILAAVAREGPEIAREHLERVIAALQAALDEMGDAPADHGTTAVIRGTAGSFTGHVQRRSMQPQRVAV